MTDNTTPDGVKALRWLRFERMNRLMEAARSGEEVVQPGPGGDLHVTQPPTVQEGRQLADIWRHQKETPGDGDSVDS